MHSQPQQYPITFRLLFLSVFNPCFIRGSFVFLAPWRNKFLGYRLAESVTLLSTLLFSLNPRLVRFRKLTRGDELGNSGDEEFGECVARNECLFPEP